MSETADTGSGRTGRPITTDTVGLSGDVPDSKTDDAQLPKSEDKDLISTILGEMKSEFNRDLLESIDKSDDPEIPADGKKKEARRSLSSDKKNKETGLAKPCSSLDSNKKVRARSLEVVAESNKKVRTRSLEVLKNGTKVGPKDGRLTPLPKTLTPLIKSVAKEKSKETPKPTMKEKPKEVGLVKESLREAGLGSKIILKDKLREVPKTISKISDIGILVSKDSVKEESKLSVEDEDVLITKATDTLETKPRIVITLKASEETLEGHKKQKSKAGNAQSVSEEVWTVKVEPSSDPVTPLSTGKRSLRSHTVVKSVPEPEGVKRSARRRSKDLPRESVLQSAIARKEKSFSLGQSEEKQCRTPRHRSPISHPEKPIKSPDSKKTLVKTLRSDVTVLTKVVKLDNGNTPTFKISKQDPLSPKVVKSEATRALKLDVTAVEIIKTDNINTASSSDVQIETVPLVSNHLPVLSAKTILRPKLSSEMRSKIARPLVGRTTSTGSRVMLAMKSAPSSVPSLVYTKTGKRRYKPFRGLKYTLNSGYASRRSKLALRSRTGESPIDPMMESLSAEIPVLGRDAASDGNDLNSHPVIDEASQNTQSAQPNVIYKRKASSELDCLGGEGSKRGRENIAPSPSPADSNQLPAKPESTAISRGAGTAGLCLCQTRSQLFVSTVVGASDIYCQAVDSLDDRLVGCCNSIVGDEVRMLRPSKKVPYMILCNVHMERLIRHNSCPGCGVFCTQGKFVQCSSNHFYHRECQLVGGFCPHCGVDSPELDAALFFKSRHNPVFVLQQTKPKKRPTAKMAIVGRVISPSEYQPPADGSEALLRLPCGREVTTNGLPPSLDKEKLDTLLALANSMPTNLVGSRYSVKSLYQASKSGNAERLINVLASGLNPNHQFREGVTSLHLASLSGSFSAVHLLIQAGAEINVMDKDQNTALMLATQGGNNAVVKYLIKAGASVTLKGADGQTALHVAAKSGNLEACHYLLSVSNVGRSYINSEDDGGWTPLVWAAEHCHVLVAKFLLDRRADPFVRDSEQNIALHWSAFSGCVDISELLLNYGSEVNGVNSHGDTPLHIGARQNMYKCVLLLLMRGAKVDVKNNAGDSALECCSVNPSDCHTVISLNQQLQAVTNHPARRLLSNDISRGKELNPVQCVNNEDKEGEPTDFVYVSENCYTSNIVVDRTITSLQSCRCSRDQCTSLSCNCGNVSLQCWYDPQGKLLPDFNFADPPMIFECNQGCACNRVTCHNRVVQHGLTCRFQLFRTREKGWGVRTLRHIQKGAYVCEYIGEIISDCEADHREDDSYLFDLDNRDGETYCIDARHYGNVARFINHMCLPNLMPVRVFIDHQDLHFPRIAFFANRDIAADEELGFDYGEKFWIIKCKSFTCTCGAETCRYSDLTIQQTLENYQRRQLLEDSLQ